MIWRSIENFTASALRGVPSWKLTPLRSLNVYFRPSLLIAHDSASPGTTCVLSSGKVTSVSTMRRPTRLELRSVTCAGSRFTGSATRPTTSVPAGWAATGASAPTPRSSATTASHVVSILIARSRRRREIGSRHMDASLSAATVYDRAGACKAPGVESRRRPTMRYEVVEGSEQLPKGFEHRDVAGVAVDGEDRVFLICRGGHPIIPYDQKVAFLRSWGVPGTGPGQVYLPHGIAVGADGRVFVCYRVSDRLQIFSSDGEYLSEWTDTQRPTHIVFDEQGRAYVSELWWHKGQTSRRHGVTQEPKHGRVSVFDKDGRLLARWGTPEATKPGSFAAPHGLAVDSKGAVYVAEVTWTFAVSRGLAPADCHTFQKFTPRA